MIQRNQQIAFETYHRRVRLQDDRAVVLGCLESEAIQHGNSTHKKDFKTLEITEIWF